MSHPRTNEERLAALERDIANLYQLLDGRFEAHGREHVLIDQAMVRARETVDYRLAGMNELREQIASERGHYVLRAAFEAHREMVTKELSALVSRIATLEGRMMLIVMTLSTIMATAAAGVVGLVLGLI